MTYAAESYAQKTMISLEMRTLSFIGNGALFKINLHDFIIHNNWTLK